MMRDFKMSALNVKMTYIPNDSLDHFIGESKRKAKTLDEIESSED